MIQQPTAEHDDHRRAAPPTPEELTAMLMVFDRNKDQKLLKSEGRRLLDMRLS